MAIALACPRCAGSIPASLELAGKRAMCPQCRMQLTLPAALYELPGGDREERVDSRTPIRLKTLLPWVFGIAIVIAAFLIVCLVPAGVIHLLLRSDQSANDMAAAAVVLPVGVDLPAGAPKRSMRVTEFEGVFQVRSELNQNDSAYTYKPAGGLGNNNNKRCKEYVIDLEAGKDYVLDLESQNFDAYLRLGHLNGTKIAEDDDSGGNLNSRIRFRPPATGSYVVTATSLGGGFGAYTLTIRESRFKKPR